MKRFRIMNGANESVLGGDVGEGNVYITTYGTVVRGEKAVSDLAVGESTLKRYCLSGSRPTVYRILRLTDHNEGESK